MKYIAAAVAGLLVFSGLILSTCEKRQTDIYAVVNGINVRGPDFLTEENRKDEQAIKLALLAHIEKTIIEMEAKKLNTTDVDLLGFFDSIKNRNIPANELEKVFKAEFKDQSIGPQSKESMLNAVRNKQFDLARRNYINELKERSTILLVDDEGVFHPFKFELN